MAVWVAVRVFDKSMLFIAFADKNSREPILSWSIFLRLSGFHFQQGKRSVDGEKRMRKTREEVAAHIGPLCMQLRTLATEAKLDTLAFILEMASLEASNLHLAILQAKAKQMREERKAARILKHKRRSTTASAA